MSLPEIAMNHGQTELHRLPLTELSRQLHDGRLAARALLDHCLARIAALDPRINAFTFVDPDAARSAEESDRRLGAGQARSPLEGVPVAIKDNLLVGGQPATWGSRLFADYVPDHDELPVRTLREAGAVLLGKTNVPEFTLRGYTDNALFGVTRNPWDPALTPGGSSGGSVAAVAAGLVPLALGTDGGGSIRRPAGHTGLVGLKPSIGRIARGAGFPPLLLDCEVVGPIARRVEDVRLALSVLAGPRPPDQRSLALFPLPDDQAPAPLRILFVDRFGDAPVDPAIQASCAVAKSRLAALGHHVAAGPLPFSITALDAVWSKIADVGLAALARQRPEFWDHATAPYVAQARAGAEICGVEFAHVLDVLTAVRAAAGEAFTTVDMIATPTTAAQPWRADQVFPPVIDGRAVGPRGHAVFTAWVNACGHPALSVPIDPAADGMPIGLQLVSGFGREALLLDVAEACEQRWPWAHRWPALAK